MPYYIIKAKGSTQIPMHNLVHVPLTGQMVGGLWENITVLAWKDPSETNWHRYRSSPNNKRIRSDQIVIIRETTREDMLGILLNAV